MVNRTPNCHANENVAIDKGKKKNGVEKEGRRLAGHGLVEERGVVL